MFLEILPPHLPGVDCVLLLSMWERITIPMYRSWFHGLYRLHGPCCPQKPLYSLQEPKAAVHWKFFIIMFRDVFLLSEIMQVFPIYLLISLPLTEIEMYMVMKLPLHVHYVQVLSIDLSLQPLAGGWPLTQPSHPFSWVEHVVYWPYWI